MSAFIIGMPKIHIAASANVIPKTAKGYGSRSERIGPKIIMSKGDINPYVKRNKRTNEKNK